MIRRHRARWAAPFALVVTACSSTSGAPGWLGIDSGTSGADGAASDDASTGDDANGGPSGGEDAGRTDAGFSTGGQADSAPDVAMAVKDAGAGTDAGMTPADAAATGTDGGGTAPPGIGACLNATGGCTEFLPGDEAVIAGAQAACTGSGGAWKASCPAQTTKGCKFPPGAGAPPMPSGYIIWDYGATSSPRDQCVQSVNVKTDVAGPSAPPSGITCTSSLNLAGSCTVTSASKTLLCTAYYAADITTITASCTNGTFSTSSCAGGAKGHCVSAYASTTTEYVNYFYQSDLSADCTAGKGLWCP